MSGSENVFSGCMPALMTPCTANGVPDYAALVAKGRELVDAGMSAVVYCGSMGDWPLLTEAQRQEGVRQLVEADRPTLAILMLRRRLPMRLMLQQWAQQD